LEWGIVDEAYLRAQYAEYVQSDDKNQEHYRARAFHDFLSRRVQLTDETVDCIFRLTDEGPDGCDLTTNRIIELIVGGLLTDEQHFALAGHHPIVRQPPIERCYDRASLLIKIRRTGLAANFSDVQACADSVIHLNLLEHPELAREHLEWLASAGANKSIRNRAQSMLRSKRFREL
jgi:hypothetical protein